MLKNMLLAATVVTVFSAAAVSALQLKSLPRATASCGGPCSTTQPCTSVVNGCTCLLFPGAPNGRGLCTIIGPAATATR